MKKKILIAMLIGTLLIATVLPVTGTTSDKKSSDVENREDADWWVRYHHDLQSTGFSTSTAPSICVRNWTWTFDYYSPEYDDFITSPVVAKGKVFVGVTMDWAMPSIFPRDHRLVCFDSSTGSILWDYVLGPWDIGYRMTAAAAIEGDKIYVGCIGAYGVGRLICLNVSDGAEQWIYSIDRPVVGSPLVFDNKVYFGASAYNVDNGHEGFYCVDATTGAEVWKRLATPQDPIYPNNANPVFHKGRVYVTSGTSDWFERVFCLDAYTGQTIWKYDRWDHLANSFTRSSPVIYDGKFYNTLQTSGGEILYCLDAKGNKDGTTNLLWETVVTDSSASSHPISPSAANGCIYVGASDSMTTTLCSFNASTGDRLWESSINYPISPEGIAIADGKLYFGTMNDALPYEGNYVYCVSASNGEVLWRYIISGSIWTSPAIADGNVYVSTGDGPFDAGVSELYCFGGENHAPDAPAQPLGPTEGRAGTSYGFSTRTTDFDGNEVKYGWDWNGDGTVDEWTDEYYETYPIVETSDITHTWTDAGTYQVRVKAKDIYDAEGPWSEALQIVIQPGQAALQATVKGGLGVTISIENIGEIEATDISWNVSCNGGLLILPLGGKKGGSIDSLTAGQSIEKQMFMLGFGKTTLTVELSGLDITPVTTTKPAFILGPFVLL